MSEVDPVIPFLAGATYAPQREAQEETNMRIVQAGFMQQGHDVDTAETLARIHMRSQPKPQDPVDEWIVAILILVALFFLGGPLLAFVIFPLFS